MKHALFCLFKMITIDLMLLFSLFCFQISRSAVNIVFFFIFYFLVEKVRLILVLFVLAPLQCVGVINLGGEVGCMISEGPWVFVGIPNFVKVGKRNRHHFCFSLILYPANFQIKYISII